MTPGTQNIVETFWQQTSVRHRDVRKLRRQGWGHPDFIVPDLSGVPLLARHLAQSGESPAVANTDLRCAKHEKSLRKARRASAIDFEMTDGKLTRAQFYRGLILDIDGAIACKTRAEEQSHVVTPGHERLLKKFNPFAAKGHKGRERFRLVAAKRKPAFHIDAAEQEHSIHAMMDIAGVNISLTLRACARNQIGVAGGVDDDFR